MTRLIFDIETDGLLDQMTVIHSLVTKDADTGEVRSYADHPGYCPIDAGLEALTRANEIIGHNIIKFDIPAIQKVSPGFEPEGRVTDTLTLSRLGWPDIKESDFKRVRARRLDRHLLGSYGLEAWGQRLGCWKGDYSKVRKAEIIESSKAAGLKPPKAAELNTMVWAEWSKDMQDYCEQDVEVTHALLAHCEKKGLSPEAVELEHRVANLCAQIEKNGFPFNERGAGDLYAKLLARRNEVEHELQRAFRPWWASEGLVDPKRTVRYKDPERPDRVKGQPWTKIKLVEFNPASRHHIASRLIAMHGWKPAEFTDNGQPKVDEEVLSGLPYPEAKLLAEYFLLTKRIGQLAEGNQAWLKASRDGFVHHSINTNAAVTGRATHAYFNIAQVPGVTVPYGKECRSLFGLYDGCSVYALWPDACMIGTDMAGLELRALAHFMAKYDEGAYAEALLSGDVHWMTVVGLGLVPEGTERDEERYPLHKLYRAVAKTFIYGFLYGAGLWKIGHIILSAALAEEANGMGSSIRQRFFKGAEAPTEEDLRRVGKRLRANFLSKVPALSRLIDTVKVAATQRGWLFGLDKRSVPIRHAFAALNTLLQSAGAIICKRWIVEVEAALVAEGYKHGWDGDFAILAWVHDELQIMCKNKEVADAVARLSARVAIEVGEHFKLRLPLAADSTAPGKTWADTH